MYIIFECAKRCINNNGHNYVVYVKKESYSNIIRSFYLTVYLTF